MVIKTRRAGGGGGAVIQRRSELRQQSLISLRHQLDGALGVRPKPNPVTLCVICFYYVTGDGAASTSTCPHD